MNHRCHPSRNAFTFTEVMVSLAIFTALVAVMMSSTVDTVSYLFYQDQNASVIDDTVRTRLLLNNDMKNSGAFPNYDSEKMTTKVDPLTNIAHPLYPKTAVTTAVGSWPQGHVLEFIRIRNTNGIVDNPQPDSADSNDLTWSNAVHFDKLEQAWATPFYIINSKPGAGSAGKILIAPVWESDRSGLSFDENLNEFKVRHYRYVLVPDGKVPSTLDDATVYSSVSDYTLITKPGDSPAQYSGMLIRQYRNPDTSKWITTGGRAMATGIDPVTFQIAKKDDDNQDGSGPVILNDEEIRIHMVIRRPLKARETWPTQPFVIDINGVFQRISY